MRCAYEEEDGVYCGAFVVPGQMFCLYHLKSDLDENGEPYDEG